MVNPSRTPAAGAFYGTLMTRWLARLRRRLSRRTLGQRGERAAARHLRRRGYRILEANLRTRLGEVDLLAEDPRNGTLVLVEVKTTAREEPPPEAHVDRRKRRKLTTLGRQLLRSRGADRLVRLDVVAIVWPDGSWRPTRLTHHERAF